MRVSGRFHLTYCSNIHPGETWEEVFRNLNEFVPAVRDRLQSGASFGLGLRLSAIAAEALDNPLELDRLKRFLEDRNCYVFTMNGFPYGAFHRTRVKENVYLPDWRDEARLTYTNRLARLLAQLLPPDAPSLEGTVSTVPGAFRAGVRTMDDERRMASMMLSHAAFLDDLRRQTGRTVRLAIEPEPRCHLETIEDTVGFFERCLFDGNAEPGLDVDVIRRHIGVCYDACHMATEFEEVDNALRRLSQAGIGVYKIQISSALRLRFTAGDLRIHGLLKPFAESTYLHQVVEKRGETFVRFTDLPDALEADERKNKTVAAGGDKEWRVHFHVPIFLSQIGAFETTQDHLIRLLEFLKRKPVCSHLEVETYTWDVLPAKYRNVDTVTAISRELNWVLERLRAEGQPAS